MPESSGRSRRFKLIACEILYREVCAVVARSIHRVDVEFLPKGLHDIGHEKMSARLAEVLGGVDESCYDAVLLGYALCNNGIVGLRAGSVPLVVPKAHDCITLFLGDKDRYGVYFRENPGTYFETTGWLERGGELQQQSAGFAERTDGLGMTYEQMVEKYGEENARFLWDQIGDLTQNYSKIAFIRMGIEPDTRFEDRARATADKRGWEFEILDGDISLLQRLVDGDWSENAFLVVPPGEAIAASFDDSVVQLRREAVGRRQKTEEEGRVAEGQSGKGAK